MDRVHSFGVVEKQICVSRYDSFSQLYKFTVVFAYGAHRIKLVQMWNSTCLVLHIVSPHTTYISSHSRELTALPKNYRPKVGAFSNIEYCVNEPARKAQFFGQRKRRLESGVLSNTYLLMDCEWHTVRMPMCNFGNASSYM